MANSVLLVLTISASASLCSASRVRPHAKEISGNAESSPWSKIPAVPGFVKDLGFPTACQIEGGKDAWLLMAPSQKMSTRIDSQSSTSIAPHAFRDQTAWHNRLLFWSISEGCQNTYTSVCKEGTMQLHVVSNCTAEPKFERVDYQGVSTCAMEEYKGTYLGFSYVGGHPKKDIFILDSDQIEHKLEKGLCIKVWREDPTSGLELVGFDEDMMPGAMDGSDVNSSMVEKVVGKLKDAGVDAVNAVKSQVNEAVDDVNSIYGADTAYGKLNATEKALLKYAKKTLVSSIIPACLCCKVPELDVKTSLAEQCKYVYALGATNKDPQGWMEKTRYGIKVGVGTAYKLMQSAVNDIIPFMGGTLLNDGQGPVCQFACEMRESERWEEYKYSRIGQIPGLALNTLIPNLAKGGLNSFVGAGNAADVVGNVVDDAVPFDTGAF